MKIHFALYTKTKTKRSGREIEICKKLDHYPTEEEIQQEWDRLDGKGLNPIESRVDKTFVRGNTNG